MSDDLVKRLRNFPMLEGSKLCKDAADRIEKLVEENGVLFAANVRLNSRADLDCDHSRDRIKKLEAEVKRLEQQLKMARRLAHRRQPEYPPEIGVPHLKED